MILLKCHQITNLVVLSLLLIKKKSKHITFLRISSSHLLPKQIWTLGNVEGIIQKPLRTQLEILILFFAVVFWSFRNYILVIFRDLCSYPTNGIISLIWAFHGLKHFLIDAYILTYYTEQKCIWPIFLLSKFSMANILVNINSSYMLLSYIRSANLLLSPIS